MFPFVIPGAVLGISLIVAFNKEPVILTGTAVIMIIAFVVRKLPYTVRSGSAFLTADGSKRRRSVYQSWSITYADIYQGDSKINGTWRIIRCDLKLDHLYQGAVFQCYALRRQDQYISVAIYTEVVRNSFGTAAALASILTVSTVISLLIFLKVSKGKVSIV